ncbi:MAG: TlpA family protein disulfide reductase [Alphaproteobacteria bacterium]
MGRGVKLRVLTVVLAVAMLLSSAVAAPVAAHEPKPFVRGSLAGIVAAHAGSPFIVAFWSTDCVPCLVNLRLWRELIEERPDIALVLVSTDRPDDLPRLQRLIERHKLQAAESWMFADAFIERLYADVDRSWGGELPRTHLFDAHGERRLVEGIIDKHALIDWIDSRKLTNANHPR